MKLVKKISLKLCKKLECFRTVDRFVKFINLNIIRKNRVKNIKALLGIIIIIIFNLYKIKLKRI